MKTIWQCLSFDSLTNKQLYLILQARSAVFVVEQNCPYLDADGVDFECHHLCAWTEDGRLAAYLRIVPPGLKYPEASLGRVISSDFARGTGIGKQLLTRGVEQCLALYPAHPIRIGAQQYLEKFYQGFGFVTVSDMYLEDDIPHVEMLRA